MNVARLSFVPYELPLREPLHTARGSLTVRNGFLIALFSDTGAVGIGEVAPLPEFGTENHAAAERRLTQLSERSMWPACDYGIEEIAVWRQKLWLSPVTHPATSFGLECAMLSLLCQSDPAPVQEQLSVHTADRLQINALISGERNADVIAGANLAVAGGYRTLKVKTGMRVVEEDIQLLQRLHELFPHVRFRVDANSGWSVDESLMFAQATEDLALEYIEDPVPPELLDDLLREPDSSTLPLAIDEAVRSPEILPIGTRTEAIAARSKSVNIRA